MPILIYILSEKKQKMSNIIIWTILWIIGFIAGYLLIYFSADVFLDNLKELSLKYKISPFILGSIILGIDPEESIASIISSINGLPYVAIGNVIGNSIIAITLCFALPVFFYKIKLKSIKQFYFYLIYIALGGILVGFVFDIPIFYSGIITISVYLINLFYNYRKSRIKGNSIDFDQEFFGAEMEKEDEENEQNKSVKRMVFYVIISFLIIILGGELLIYSTNQLIILTGIGESIFGFIIIAFMTNVEELTLIIKGIKRGRVGLEIGVGGMIGKIIWNLTLTYGISVIIIYQIESNIILLLNWLILVITMLIFNLLVRKRTLYWKEGILLMTVFTIFIILNFL